MKTPLLTAMLMLTGLAACSGQHDHDHGHGAHEDAKGPQGGRLLEDGPFSLEVVIFEEAVRPEYRLYPRVDRQAVPPEQVQARIDLHRINGLPGGTVDRHVFAPMEDYLVSDLEVYEPHSFDVTVAATFKGQTHEWTYAAPEGRVEIASDMAEAMNVTVGVAGPGTIRKQRTLYGQIEADPERRRRITARFPSVVRSVEVAVGDVVTAGQVMARIESNESLQTVSVTAPIAGTVVHREINPGESTAGELMFEIVDLTRLWAVLNRFDHDQAQVRVGLPVRLEGDGVFADAPITYIAPIRAPGAPTAVRVDLDNAAAAWTPGQRVTGVVTVSETMAPQVVPLSALQTFRDWDVVFVVEDGRYQAQPVELGRRDDTHAEVLSGLESGARFVVENAYLLKADIEKSGASHDH